MDNYCPSHPEKMASSFRHIASLEIPFLKQERQNPRDHVLAALFSVLMNVKVKASRRKLRVFEETAYDPSCFLFFFLIYLLLS